MSAWIWWIAFGVLAGAIGTWLMGLVMGAVTKLEASRRPSTHAAMATKAPEDPWDAASAPAKVAEKGVELVDGGKEPDPKYIKPFSVIMDYGYGSTFGVGYGVVAGLIGFTGGLAAWPQWLIGGTLLGLFSWLLQYVLLVPMGIYKHWFWKYPGSVIAKDLGFHMFFGYAVAVLFAAGYTVLGLF